MTPLGGALLLVGLAGASGCVTSIGSDLARDAPVARDRLGPVRRVPSVIGWPPLLPVMPFNLAWRWIRGDMSDEFERRLAAELRALLRHAPAGEADRRPPGDTAAARLLPAWTIEDLRIDRSTIVQYGRARGSGWCSWASATYRSS